MQLCFAVISVIGLQDSTRQAGQDKEQLQKSSTDGVVVQIDTC